MDGKKKEGWNDDSKVRNPRDEENFGRKMQEHLLRGKKA
jgi:hypothetical protein